MIEEPDIEIPADLPLTLLSHRCRQETRRFWQRQPYDPRFCHALFGRALAQPHAASSKEAWQHLHNAYHAQVTIWVKGHPHFPATRVNPTTLADLALERMWLSFANAPEKYGRFPHHDPDQGLRTLLRFLQTCVHSTVMNALRRPLEPLPETLAHYDPPPQSAESFWNCIEQRLNDDREKLLIDATFVFGLKPRQILALYPDDFANIKEIYRLKENILARFKRDASLSHCLEMVNDIQ